eukprot:SAG31_NODE_5728_length_2357_cov_1.799823_2_plen_81_part_00
MGVPHRTEGWLRHQARCMAGTATAASACSGSKWRHAAVMRDGRHIPLVGLGTYLSAEGEETEQNCLSALANGYRHIDTAQ